jgi:hypothetical protein
VNYSGQSPNASATKYQSESLDYGIDWYYTAEDPWLLVDESIIASSWAIITGDGQLNVEQTDFTETGTAIYLSAGTPLMIYIIRNTIVTDKGRTGVAQFELTIAA